jgi:DNA polymerase kappa
MEGDGWTGRTITLKYKLDTYQGVPTPFPRVLKPILIATLVFTRAKSMDHWVSKKEELFNVRRLFVSVITRTQLFVLDWEGPSSR